MTTTYRLGPEEIEAFCKAWPCHGLPANLDSLEATFADNGDLVDYEGFDEFEGVSIDLRGHDGPALAALIDDCQTKGELQ